MPELPSALTRYREAIEAELRQALPGGSPHLLYRMMCYHMGWEDQEGRPSQASGKALRPALCLWSCQAVGGDWAKCLPAAAALELVHQFSLIHDDIQDGDTERRHRPTVWSLWGQPQAINAGDAMLTIAHLTLLRLESAAGGGLPRAKVLQASQALQQAVLAIIEGQCLDLSFEENLEVSVDAYLEMIGKKTGALYRCALYLGALAGSDDEERQSAMASYGLALGLAFQVVDDTLGVWGDQDRTGKPAAADIRRRKKSLPVVYALERARGGSRRALLHIYGKEALDDEEVSAVLAILEELGARAYCGRMAARCGREALAHLAEAGLSPEARSEAQAIVDFLLQREY